MKIALCFAGQPREVLDCYDSIQKNIITPNDIEDIFIHSWWRPEFEEGYNINVHEHGLGMPKDVLDLIKDKYRPKEFLAENDHEKTFHDPATIVSPVILTNLVENMLPMLYSRYYVNVLKNKYALENNKTYDMVLLMRHDTFIRKEIKLDQFDPDILHSTRFLNNPFNEDYFGDIFQFTSEKNMDTFVEMYEHLPDISSKIPKLCAEFILGVWCKMNDIKVAGSIHYPDDIVIFRALLAHAFPGVNLSILGDAVTEEIKARSLHHRTENKTI